jgi:hypothetical protein
MRHPDNSYEFDKLNARFDRKMDHLKRTYDIEAQNIFRADSVGTSIRRRNPLWAWFDRKTKFRIFPKILLALTPLTFGAIVYYIVSPTFPHLFGDYSPDDCRGIFILVPGLVAELLCCIAVFSSGQGNDNPFQMSIDLVTNPAWKDLECNVYHRKDDRQARQRADINRALRSDPHLFGPRRFP